MDLSRDVVFGHEFCCEVLDYGPGTDAALKPGTRVCSLPALLDARKVRRASAIPTTIPAAIAERMVLTEPLLLEVPNGLAAEHAALTEPLAVGIHAVAKADCSGDEVPLVIGCGPVGLAVIAALKAARARTRSSPPTISPARRALAEKMGADIVVDPARTQPYATWAEHARCRRSRRPRGRRCRRCCRRSSRALIFECVGVPGVMQQLFEAAPRGARIVVAGVCMETDRIEPLFGIIKELELSSSCSATRPRNSPVAAPDRRRAGRRRAAGHRQVGIDGVAKAFADLANPERIPRSSSSRGGEDLFHPPFEGAGGPHGAQHREAAGCPTINACSVRRGETFTPPRLENMQLYHVIASAA